jgi:hypothetical protein
MTPEAPSAAAPTPGRDLPAFALLLLALLVPASRLAVLLHEAVGHALTAALLGARVTGIDISLFGGGATHYTFGPGTGPAARALAAWGGIGINLLTGWIAIALGRRLDHRPVLALFVSLFASASLLGAIAYAALGFYYHVGDPALATARDGGHAMWIVWLAAAPAAAWVALRRYGEIQATLLPSNTAARRIGIAAATLGASCAAYAGLHAIEGRPLVAADAASMDRRRAEAEARRHRLEEALAKARAAHPDLGEAELRRLVESSLPPLRPEEVPSRFPLAPVIAGLYAAGGIGGLACARAPGKTIPPPAPRAAAWAAGLAVLLLAFLAAAG